MAATKRRAAPARKSRAGGAKKASRGTARPVSVTPRQGAIRRTVRWLFSHALVAALAIAAVYIHAHPQNVKARAEAALLSNSWLAGTLSQYAGWPPGKRSSDSKKGDAKTATLRPEPAAGQPRRAMARPNKTPTAPKAGSNPASRSTATSAPGDLAAGWRAARAAYWARDTDTIAKYRRLTERFPDTPALHGEFGNIFYQAGRRDEAAAQFLKAGRLFARQSRDREATALAAVLDRLDPARARELRTILAQSN